MMYIKFTFNNGKYLQLKTCKNVLLCLQNVKLNVYCILDIQTV